MDKSLMRLIALFLISLPAFGTAYVANTTGNWNSATTWSGAGVPGDGDTCTINNGVTVTVSDAEICGNSPAAGTVVLNFNGSGTVTIASGGTLRLRGDGQWTAGDANTSAYMTVQAGGTFIFDAHLASSPSTTQYKIAPDASGWGARVLVTLGSTVSRATVMSDSGGGNGYFWTNPTSLVGGNYNLQWTDFTRIGDASQDAFRVFWADAAHNAWVSMYNKFTSCGRLPRVDSSISQDGVFRHNFNVHVNSLGSAVMSVGGASADKTTGTRELIGNVFDKLADAGMDARSFTIHSNYFPDLLGIGGFGDRTSRWALFSNNFMRDANPSAGQYITPLGDIGPTIWFLDAHSFVNPHGPGMALSSMNYTDNIGDYGGNLTSSMSAFFIGNAGSDPGATYNFTGTIILPGMGGNSSTWMGGPTSIATTTEVFNHSTVVVTQPDGGVDPAVVVGHSSTDPDTSHVNLTNSIMWTPPGKTPYYKLAAIHDLPANVDICPPSLCDYNVGSGTSTGGGGYPGGANGYASRFSSTPGVHDLAVGTNPNFLDMTRNVATFDTSYLGRSAPLWNSGTTYSIGDIVSSSDPSVYGTTSMKFPGGGAVINYQYVNGTYEWTGTACGGANPQPGIANDVSRACWRWATLYDIEVAQGYCTISCVACPGSGIRVGGQCLYEDSDIGVYGNDIITTLIQWIRSGYAPTNEALAFAGSDGFDIGAVPVRYPATTFPTVTTTHTTVRGSTLRGIVIR